MLINKGYAEGDIVCFKLVNGDETVAKIVEDNSDSFVVAKPCTVVPGRQGLGLIQSLFSGELNSNITLNKSHVMMHSTVVDDIKNHYIQTTTGIQPVTKGSIIT
jgi:hypothetical protein